MPFIYRLHYSLALDTFGSYAFGIVALLWTLDCFVAIWLSFPLSVKKTAFAYQPKRSTDSPLQTPLLTPPIDWYEARRIGREQMAKLAEIRGFSVLREDMLSNDPRTGIYRYRVRSSRDVSEHWGGLTALYIDGRNGETGDLWLTTGAPPATPLPPGSPQCTWRPCGDCR